MSNGGWTLIARFSNADSANWRTVVIGGMTEQHFVAVLPIHLTTMTCYNLHFGSFKLIAISKSLEVMTVLTRDYSKLVAVPVGELLEALLPASVLVQI